MQLIGNIIWIILIGWESALVWLVAGLVCCITVIGIPIGLQCLPNSRSCPLGNKSSIAAAPHR